MFQVGTLVIDKRRNTVQTIDSIDYKRGDTLYTVKRIDGTYRRYYSAKFEKYFSLYSETSQTGTGGSTSHRSNSRANKPQPAKNITPQIENFIESHIEAPKSSKRVSKQNALVWYSNVIYIDFIKRCRIVVSK